jgi:nucleotide-binding universal stress UspA family protein
LAEISGIGIGDQPESHVHAGKSGLEATRPWQNLRKVLNQDRRNMAQLTTSEKIDLKNILVATDFSAVSMSALAYVVPIAREYHSVVHILHVVRPSEIGLGVTETEEDFSREVQVDAQRQLGPLEDVIGTIPHRLWLREGNVCGAVMDLVRSEHIDLIAVGATDKSDFKKFIVGSVAEDIIHNATCPVLSIGPHAFGKRNGVRPAQLLYVTSLWENSHDGLRYAIELAIEHGSRLALLHVIELEAPKKPDREWLNAFRRILRNLLPGSAANLQEKPVLRVEVTKNVTARILQVADEVRADIIVMDVHPEHALSTHFRDKVYPIISWANCPVLTVRTHVEQRAARR